MSLALKQADLQVRFAGTTEAGVAPDQFEMGGKPGKPLEFTLRFTGKLTDAAETRVEYQLVDCFYRQIALGAIKTQRSSDGALAAVLTLTPEQSHRLYYGEWFTLTALLRTADGNLVAAEAWNEVKLKYAGRDALALPSLPDQPAESTPYGGAEAGRRHRRVCRSDRRAAPVQRRRYSRRMGRPPGVC
ncbi:MAG: hypothetical protein QM760_15060 [Nibricoccus sp.]